MYQAMYRKYRPQTFDDVSGQEQVVKTLINAVKNDRINHAYVFYGPRGTGKTTIAKIFARAVNCTDTKEGNPCGKCDLCKISKEKECVDIIEIDAASNNGVDEIRELRAKINFVPAELKYKVYIIDEVHMLTVGAFNALLKTLEEPPKHAIFILATTDFQKLPETVVSRCQCFEFKRLDDDLIVERLQHICKKEKISVDEEVLKNVAYFSDGGMRDAIGMLDKMASYEDGKITLDTFVELNGLVTKAQLKEFTDTIINSNGAKFLKMIASFNSRGKNLIQVINQELLYLRDLIVEAYLNDDAKSITDHQRLANVINENMERIKKSSNPKVFVELLLLEYIDQNAEKSTNIPMGNNISQKQNISREINSTDKKTKKDPKKQKKEEKGRKITNYEEMLDVRINNAFAKASKKDLAKMQQDFDKLRDHSFDQDRGYLICDLLEASIRAVGEEYAIISYEFDSLVKKNINQLEDLEAVCRDFVNSDYKLAIVLDDKWNELKKEYITRVKNKDKYVLQDDIQPEYEKIEKDGIIDEAISAFGDIIEYE